MAPSRMIRFLPFSSSTTILQAATYLLGISLFSISFLVFLNSAVSFVITDLLGVKTGVGDIVGTLGFVDEIVALVACPVWGLVSDRLGVRWVAVIGYTVIAISLWVFVQCRNVYPALVLARIMFAIGATAAATMVTAILPVLTSDDSALVNGDEAENGEDVRSELNANGGVATGNRPDGVNFANNQRASISMSVASDTTITPERYNQYMSETQERDLARQRSHGRQPSYSSQVDPIAADTKGRKPSALAGFVGVFTGCGALVALVLFLPLPARFSQKEGVTPARAITDSFYVVATVALAVALFVFFGLRGLKGEEGKGWRMLLGLKHRDLSAAQGSSFAQDLAVHGNASNRTCNSNGVTTKPTHGTKPLPYRHLLLTSLRLGFTDPHIALGYLGGFVARASTVAISLFIPLYVNTYFMSRGYCQGSPNDPSPDLKRECRAAYVLAASLSGVAQLIALLCAPVFGYMNARLYHGINWGVLLATSLGVVGYVVFPRLASPEFRDVQGRGGSAVVFLVVSLLGISQIGAIVCSLGSIGRGALGEDVVINSSVPADVEETEALLNGRDTREKITRVQLKGSIAGVYSWCGGVAILLLTKLGGLFFDSVSNGAPFYMMAGFNAVLLVASLGVDLGGFARRRREQL